MARDPYLYFRGEARDLHDQLGQGVLELEKSGATPDLVARMLRLAHTLKGAARVVKQGGIADGAHALEDALLPFRESAASLPRDDINAILKLLDGIERGVVALALPHGTELAAALESVRNDGVGMPRSETAETDTLLLSIAEAHTRLGTFRQTTRSVERAKRLAELLVAQSTARGFKDGVSGTGSPHDKASAPAMELHGILSTLERELGAGVDEVDRELTEVREAAEQLLLVPARSLFTSLERTVRDTADALGKHIVFEGKGGEVRLAPRLLGAVQSALLQLVKNAAAHGIESEEDRKSAGKAAAGRIAIVVARRGRRVAFTCRDDGRGVDVGAVRRAAKRSGIVTLETQRLDANELLQLLLRGGITTSPTATGISGRGVGLDVVREAAERLGGEVTVVTEVGRGTTFELIVPLSVASLEVLVVETSGMAVTIPLDAVRGTLRVTSREMSRTARGDSLVYDGNVIPFLPLQRALRAKADAYRAGRIWSAVVVEGAEGLAAIGVDRIRETSTVIVRSLPWLALAGSSVAGASIDAEGNPQLVLDPDDLVAEAHREVVGATDPETPRYSVLVVDDSLTTRMLEQSILESAGYDVDTATSGEEALERARDKPYVLFLVDVEMPGIDGFTFIERIRLDPALRDIPAILVTSRASPDDRQRGHDVGAQGYLVKSEFDQRELLARIHRLVA